MTAGLPGIASLPPIGLADLDGLAALRTRKDRKYLLPAGDLGGLVAASDGAVRVLEIEELRNFRYESVYFDTPDLDCYLAAARRRSRRSKVRTRWYLDTASAFLEVKSRQGRGLTVKRRMPCAASARGRITREGREFLEGMTEVAQFADRLQPTLTTRYRRTTLFDPRSTSRITIDTDVSWARPGGAHLQLDGVVLVETKTAGRPCAFDRLLWGSGSRPVKMSKYGTGLAALDASLPANKWHRVLRDHFGTSLADGQPHGATQLWPAGRLLPPAMG